MSSSARYRYAFDWLVLAVERIKREQLALIAPGLQAERILKPARCVDDLFNGQSARGLYLRSGLRWSRPSDRPHPP